MRRAALLATALMLPGLLTGCAGSGFYSYLGNTFTLPGANPNIAPGASETYQHVRGHAKLSQDPPPMLFEAGDVWPGPPKPPPTLKDLQIEQSKEATGTGGDYTPLAPLPKLPGYDVPEQDPRRASPPQSFPGGVVGLPQGKGVPTGAGRSPLNGPAGDGSIVVPNGNGTSTVIAPNGTVSTIPTPK